MSTILEKIESCTVFVADLTPLNGPQSDFRLTPNPNVLLELGYALATGRGRTRIICVVNTAFILDGDIKELPFDLWGIRPLVFSLEDPSHRRDTQGQEDVERTKARRDLAWKLELALQGTLKAVQAKDANRILSVTPHLATDNLERFQADFAVRPPVPIFHSLEVRYPAVGQKLREISRQQPSAH